MLKQLSIGELKEDKHESQSKISEDSDEVEETMYFDARSNSNMFRSNGPKHEPETKLEERKYSDLTAMYYTPVTSVLPTPGVTPKGFEVRKYTDESKDYNKNPSINTPDRPEIFKIYK